MKLCKPLSKLDLPPFARLAHKILLNLYFVFVPLPYFLYDAPANNLEGPISTAVYIT